MAGSGMRGSANGSTSNMRTTWLAKPEARSSTTAFAGICRLATYRPARRMRIASPPTNEMKVWLKKYPIRVVSIARLKLKSMPKTPRNSRKRNAAIDSWT